MQQLTQEYLERTVSDILEGIQGSVITETLCSLSKELVRLKQERKIAAMVHIAEADRRHRECEESGRRQAEQCLRNRED